MRREPVENWELNELAELLHGVRKLMGHGRDYRPSAELLQRERCLSRALARGEADWVKGA